MDQLRLCMNVLRLVARQHDQHQSPALNPTADRSDTFGVKLPIRELRLNGWRTLSKKKPSKAAMNLIQDYVQSCLDKVPKESEAL